MEFMDFTEIHHDSRKTKSFSVNSKASGYRLGEISFWPAWRKFTFHPEAGALFDDGCLREIAAKIETLNKEIREDWQRRRKEKQEGVNGN